jgi:hypothetical protein
MVSFPAARAASWFRGLWFFLAVAAAAMPLGCLPPDGRPARSSGNFDGGGLDGTGIDGFYLDRDEDGVTPAQGDCDDDNPMVYPGAPELCDGLDHDCNNIRDDICDNDGDGYAIRAGNGKPGGDCNDRDRRIGPGALEVQGNRLDDNCDGRVDEAIPPCDPNLPPTDPRSRAAAFELCSPWLLDASLNPGADPRAHAVLPDYGTYRPFQGPSFAVLSTGIAADADDPNYVDPQLGTDFGSQAPNPFPSDNTNSTCGTSYTDTNTVGDYLELRLTLKVPSNANGFSFRFNFLSAEYPEFVGTEYNDKFLVLLESGAYRGNVSFDQADNPITINGGFFAVCDPTAFICEGRQQGSCPQPLSQLAGTGYERIDENQEVIGGGTGWLTTTAPAVPGETAVLRFIIFDERDLFYDSAVMIDDFRWQLAAAPRPMTIP